MLIGDDNLEEKRQQQPAIMMIIGLAGVSLWQEKSIQAERQVDCLTFLLRISSTFVKSSSWLKLTANSTLMLTGCLSSGRGLVASRFREVLHLELTGPIGSVGLGEFLSRYMFCRP